MQEVLESPDFIDKIPNDAEVIFLPQNDPELCEVNRPGDGAQSDVKPAKRRAARSLTSASNWLIAPGTGLRAM